MITHQDTLFSNILYGNNWSAATYQAANRFTVQGDKRASYEVGTQVQILTSAVATMQYSYVSAVTFASNVTTVTVSDGLFASGQKINVRASPFGANNMPLGRRFKEISVFGANGLTISNASPKFTLFVEGVGAGKVNTFTFQPGSNGISFKVGRDAIGLDAMRIDATSTAITKVTLFSPLTFGATYTGGLTSLTDLLTIGQYALTYSATGSSTGSNRLYVSGPNGGEFTVGPTNDAQVFRRIRLRATDVVVENNPGGSSQAGSIWHSLNFDPDTRVTKGQNGSWMDSAYTAINNLNSAQGYFNQWASGASQAPVAGSTGVVQTMHSAGGNNFNPVAGASLVQTAYVTNGTAPALYVRRNVGASGWSAWTKLYTQADFSLGDYVKIAGGDTIQSPITVRTALSVGTTADATSTLNFGTSASPNGPAATISVTGGAATTGRGAMTVNAQSIALPSLNVNGTLNVSGASSMAGPLTITTGSILLGNGTYGESRISNTFDDWYLYSNPTGLGWYSISKGSAFSLDKNSKAFIFNGAGTINGQTTINGGLNVASGSGIITSGNVVGANGNFSNDVFAPGAFRGARLHIYSNCIAYGQGFLPSWNDYGDGATVLTNARGGGTGGFKFRQMNSDGGGQIFLAFINPNGTIGSASDERMKEFGKVLDLSDALRFIREQRVKHVKWKHTGEEDIAFGAQSIFKTTRFLAHYDKGADFWQLYYPKVALYHHEALFHILEVQNNHEADIQILIRKNENLEEEVKQLRERLDSL